MRPLPALQNGDPVAIVAPASPFDREKFGKGLVALRSLGLRPEYDDGLFARHPVEHAYLAGPDDRRLAELREALRGKGRALVLARGGYGSLRLFLNNFPLTAAEVAAHPKLLVGYSDATVLHEIWGRAGVPSIHGPMCTQLGEEQGALERLRTLLFANRRPEPVLWNPLRPVGARGGKAEGELRGGNLAVLASLCGTPLQPKFAGAIVLLEDLNEPPYRLDRLVTQLILAGCFEGVRGVVVGDLFGPGEPSGGRADAVAGQLARLGVPTVFGGPFGHSGRNQPVAFGCRHALDADRGMLAPLESPTLRQDSIA